MLWSDIVGILASVVLTFPGLKDSWYRYLSKSQRDKRKASRTGLRAFVAAAIEEKRNSFSGWDSFFMILGGAGLAVSFGLKAKGL